MRKLVSGIFLEHFLVAVPQVRYMYFLNHKYNIRHH